jgi:DNA gyrase subunit A
VLDLKELLSQYLEHRREVVRRRSEHDLAEAEERAHILEGRLTALEHADDVVERIQDADDRDAAKAALRERYDFSERQADHIVRMQLGSLTALEAEEIESEYRDVEGEIDRLETILDSDSELDRVITDELREVRDEYADDRRTRIVEDYGSVTREDLIPDEEVLVVMTDNDYIKRMPAANFDPQGRGGKGIIGTKLKEGDRVASVFRANTHDYLLAFTNRGYVHRLKVYEVPEMGRTARGKSAVNLVDLDDGEDITAVVATDDLTDEECLTMVTREGYVKRTCASDFANIHSGGLIATRLEDGDELVDVAVTDDGGDLLIASEQGMAIRFPKDEAREMGRSARGVNAIKLTDGDAVAGVVAATDGADLLTVTENGYGKRTPMGEYRTQSRYGKGLKDIKTGERNGRVTAIESATAGEDLVVMSEGGQIIRTPVGDISTVGRNTMGVKIMSLDEDRVACIDVLSD